MTSEDPDRLISELSSIEYRHFALACCRRVSHLFTDRRLLKAFRKFENFVHAPQNEQDRRDAYNVANSVYLEIRSQHGMSAEAAAACTLVCATSDDTNSGVVGNFEWALRESEGLSLEAVRAIEREFAVSAKK